MRIPALLLLALLAGCAKQKCIGSTCSAPSNVSGAPTVPATPATPQAQKLGFGGDVQAGSAPMIAGQNFMVEKSVFGGHDEAFRSTSAHFALESKANASR